MAFSLRHFTRLRPYLFHLTADRNVRRIIRTGRLDSAARVLTEGGRASMIRSKRRQNELVQVGGEVVHVRDQAPLLSGNTALSGGWTFEDFLECLNQKVFFWPGTARGPTSYGRRHYERYRGEVPAIIRIPTGSLFHANQNNPPLFCRHNSGSPRCSQGQPSPRSPLTFRTADQVEFSAARVVEVVFEQVAMLPQDAEVSWAPEGPWTKLQHGRIPTPLSQAAKDSAKSFGRCT